MWKKWKNARTRSEKGTSTSPSKDRNKAERTGEYNTGAKITNVTGTSMVNGTDTRAIVVALGTIAKELAHIRIAIQKLANRSS
jgi:LmbE family N-acetylglucosaminyl deacetylase